MICVKLSTRASTSFYCVNSLETRNCGSQGGGGRGECTPLYKQYKPYRYVPSQRTWFLGLFGLKMGMHFAHFGLKSSMVFGGTTGAYERIHVYCFNSK